MSIIGAELPEECPCCGSDDLYYNENSMLQCQECGRVIDIEYFDWLNADRMRGDAECE